MLCYNHAFAYILEYPSEFTGPGIVLFHNNTPKKAKRSPTTKKSLVFNIDNSLSSFVVNNKTFTTTSQHLTIFSHYNDSSTVFSAYHHTILCDDNEFRIYFTVKFEYIDVVAKKKSSSCVVMLTLEEKKMLFQISRNYVKNIFLRIANIPESIIARINQLSQIAVEKSYDLNSRPLNYLKALNNIYDSLEEKKPLLPQRYYTARLAIIQQQKQYTETIINKQYELSREPSTQTEEAVSSNTSINSSAQAKKTSRSSDMAELSVLKTSFSQLTEALQDAQKTENHILQMSLIQQQWDNIDQQLSLQFDIAFEEVTQSLQTRNALTHRLHDLIIQSAIHIPASIVIETLENVEKYGVDLNSLALALAFNVIIHNKPGLIHVLVQKEWIRLETLNSHKFHSKTTFPCNALRLALECDALEVFQELLTIGVDCESMTLEGTRYYRCIEAACAQGKSSFLQLLLDNHSHFLPILPSVAGQLPAQHCLTFENTFISNHYPMLIAACAHHIDCMHILATRDNVTQAIACALFVCDQHFFNAILHVFNEATYPQLGCYALQCFVNSQKSIFLNINNIERLPFFIIRLLSRSAAIYDKLEQKSCAKSVYRAQLVGGPISLRNLVTFLSQPSGPSNPLNLIATPQIDEVAAILLANPNDSSERLRSLFNTAISAEVCEDFDTEASLKKITRIFDEHAHSAFVFIFRQIINKLASPDTNLQQLGTAFYTLIYFSQQILIPPADQCTRDTTDVPTSFFAILVSTLIQLRTFYLMSLGSSAMWHGSNAAIPAENQLQQIQERLSSVSSHDWTVFDEIINTCLTYEAKMGLLQLKLALLFTSDEAFFSEISYKQCYKDLNRVSQDHTLQKNFEETVGKTGQDYLGFEMMRMNEYRKGVIEKKQALDAKDDEALFNALICSFYGGLFPSPKSAGHALKGFPSKENSASK